MRKYINNALGVLLLFAALVLCQSCTYAKCEAERFFCKLDCPETVGLKQACEQTCNIKYDICRRVE